MSHDKPTHSIRTLRLLVNAVSPKEAAELVIASEGDLDFSMISRSDITEEEHEEMERELVSWSLDDTPNPGTYEVKAVRVAQLNDQGNEVDAWTNIEEVGPRMPLSMYVDLTSDSPKYLASLQSQRLDESLPGGPSPAPGTRSIRF